jgi:hypothetical protein
MLLSFVVKAGEFPLFCLSLQGCIAFLSCRSLLCCIALLYFHSLGMVLGLV